MIDFLKVEQTVRALKKQVDAGQLAPEEFKVRLKQMVDVAPDGYYWMLGHNSEKWYRHNGHQWVADNPEEFLMTAKETSPNSPKETPTPAEPTPVDWDSVEIEWFFVSLVILGVVFSIVYVSVL